MTKIVLGTVHGRTIEMSEELGVADGLQVQVQVTVATPDAAIAGQRWGDGILRSAGALADDSSWDGIMEEMHAARQRPRRSLFNEP